MGAGVEAGGAWRGVGIWFVPWLGTEEEEGESADAGVFGTVAWPGVF